MQRFKKEQHSLRQGEPRVCHYRQCPCDKNGKFVYGANGTLTQAARWRDEAFALLKQGRALGKVESLLKSSRAGGCRLSS